MNARARPGRDVETPESARQLAVGFERATGPGATVARRLDALRLLGWEVLVDRRWAVSRRIVVDALLVGPGGVVVLDVVDWPDAGVVGSSPVGGGVQRDAEIALLRSVTDRAQDALGDLGVTRQALRTVVLVAGQRLDLHVQQVHLVGESNLATWLASLSVRFEDAEVDAVTAVLDRTFVTYDAAAPLAGRPPRSLPSTDVEELADALAVTAMAPPVDRWMTFLAPEQLAAVGSSWDGPARISGPAGSGKTVVALHRAVHLAERHVEPVLYVVPTTALSAALDGRASRLAPQTHRDIRFTTLLDLAVELVEQTGVKLHLAERQVLITFTSAWMSVARGGVLSQVDERAAYWQEEIDHQVKGRGITELGDYLALPRDGRLTVLGVPVREAVWRLYVEYQRRLERTRQHDANDVISKARDLVLAGLVSADYCAVVVDGAEDVPLVGLQLLHAIAGDGPDRLLLLDDAAQSVRPGGATLAEAGIDVADRETALGPNRRTSADLLRLADDVLGGDTAADLHGMVRPHLPGVAPRRGPAAVVMRSRDRAGLDAALLARLVETADPDGVGWGDVAVLVHTDTDLAHLRGLLMRAAVPVVDVDDRDGTTDRVVVGTFARARGLEFDHVLLPGLEQEPTALVGEHDDARRERARRRRRELYVGISRARHGLWLGYLDPA